MQEFFSIVIGLFLLAMIGFAWAFEHLRRQRRELEQLKAEILHHAEQRRDTLPYLLESYRGVLGKLPEKSVEWIAKRKGAREARGFDAAWEMEKTVEAAMEELYKNAAGKTELDTDIGWLEAKTDIQKETEALHALEQKLQKFPFMVFSETFKWKHDLRTPSRR